MFKIIDENIYCTRGDKGNIEFSCKNDDESDYIFQVGQTIFFKVYDKKDPQKIILNKKVIVENAGTSVTIPLTSSDTKISNYINKPIKYSYEVSIDDDITVIGYDENGAKDFILMPEGGDE